MHRVSRALYVMGAPALSRAIRSTTRRHGLTPALTGHRMTGLNGADKAMPALLRLRNYAGTSASNGGWRRYLRAPAWEAGGAAPALKLNVVANDVQRQSLLALRSEMKHRRDTRTVSADFPGRRRVVGKIMQASEQIAFLYVCSSSTVGSQIPSLGQGT